MKPTQSRFQLQYFIYGSIIVSACSLVAVTEYYEVLSNIYDGMLPSTYIITLMLLWQHVGLALCARNHCLDSITTFMRSTLYFLGITVIIHIITVLFGAPVLTAVRDTFNFALLVSVTAVLPGFCVLGVNSKQWTRVFVQHIVNDGPEILCHCVGIFSPLGAWFGAFPIPLDWDRPWQQWPRSCLIGCLCGHLLGLIISSFRIRYHKPDTVKSN